MLKNAIRATLLFIIFISCQAFASPGFNALIDAVNNRDYDTVNNMLLANNDKSLIRERDNAGRTILHYAANKGNTKVLGLFLAAGADPNALDNQGQTPIFYAVNRAFEDNAQMLITAGANVNIANRTRFTPLLLASQKGKPKMTRILIRAGADVNAVSAAGATALMFAAARGNTDLIELLLRNRADLRARDKLGNTAMHYAAKNNRYKVVDLLKPLINKRNNAGQTPLDIAALGGNNTRDVTTELLKNGAKTGR